MYITELETPAVLLDLDIAEKNLQTYQQACDKYEKSLWPMVNWVQKAFCAAPLTNAKWQWLPAQEKSCMPIPLPIPKTSVALPPLHIRQM